MKSKPPDSVGKLSDWKRKEKEENGGKKGKGMTVVVVE